MWSRKVTANQQPHHFLCDKNLATWGRIQRDERWWWSTSKEECHLLLTHWSHFIASSRKVTATFLCRQNHLRSQTKVMKIYFKRRVSSFADSLMSLYRFIPESNRKSTTASFFMWPHHFLCDKNLATTASFFTWQKSSHVRSHSTRRKMMMIYFKKKSVIFCWLTEVTLSLHPGK